ncbi:MAG: hypothetical protein HYX78_03140 [Armatimonadetes bacterium]|nr:hypothetical protein [Armatimonadota bacterium]
MTSTLTSLAMLKVHVDQGQDYLDYLQPFILQILVDHKPGPVTDIVVKDYIRTDFGLAIPERAVQVVLKRLSRKYPLKKEQGVYQITGDLPDPRIGPEKADADRHIRAVVAGLKEFSKSTLKPIVADDVAVTAICSFLSQFNIPCIRAYLRGTAIPTVEDHHDAQVILVSKYVLTLQNKDPERFESFLVVVTGHMLANALLCPDLQNAPKTYKGVTFYLDTPLLVRRLGLEGEPKQASVENLIRLLHDLGARVATFSHSRDELEHVVTGAADHIEAPDGRGAIVMEARTRGTTKSDMLLLAGQIDDKLSQAGIEVLSTPRYIEDFQIGEAEFAEALDDEVSYFNPRAKDYDINSVRSIYVLREGTAPTGIERSRAVLVTSNAGFSRAAFQYGQRHRESREVSSVITDFSLANTAWLKAPLGAPNLPMTEVLAFSYAALQPSKELLDKYLSEIDKLEKRGKITSRDHQILRSSYLAQDEMMSLTLGEEDALTEQTIKETLRRVTDEIKKEENDRLRAEQAAHDLTLEKLAAERAEKEQIQRRLYWRCARSAKRWSWAIAALAAALLLGGVATGLGLMSSAPLMGWILLIGSGLATILSALDLMVGFSVKEMRVKLEKRLLTQFLKREAAATGLKLEDTE